MILGWWMVAASANAVIVVVYAWISFIMIQGLQEGRQWRSNPIAVATAAIFVSCTVGHGLHLLHVIPPWSTLDPAAAAAGRQMFSSPALIAWDAFTAIMAIGYWFLRHRLAIVYQGSSLNEDFKERQQQAALLHSRVVAGVDRASAQLAAGEREAALATLADSIEAGKDVISTLAGSASRRRVRPGDLRRDAASR